MPQLTISLARIDRFTAAALVSLIGWYQRLLRPFVGNACRYEPSCSHYAQLALGQHGTLKGVCLGVARICRCHPYARGGFDPVPEQLTLSSFLNSSDKSRISDGSQT